jgi:hypothetical protein
VKTSCSSDERGDDRELRALVETGAVTGVHRAGASLNVHVHLHVLCLDGVYVEADDGSLRFEAAPAPSREELQETLEYLYARVVKWLSRRGLLHGDADASNEAPSYRGPLAWPTRIEGQAHRDDAISRG